YGRTLHILNVHLGLRQRERATQVQWLVERHILGNERPGPRIVVGDLNEWFPGRVGRTLPPEVTSLSARRTPPPLPAPSAPPRLPGRVARSSPEPHRARRLRSPAAGGHPPTSFGAARLILGGRVTVVAWPGRSASEPGPPDATGQSTPAISTRHTGPLRNM